MAWCLVKDTYNSTVLYCTDRKYLVTVLPCEAVFMAAFFENEPNFKPRSPGNENIRDGTNIVLQCLNVNYETNHARHKKLNTAP
jgi:hypothetical protein